MKELKSIDVGRYAMLMALTETRVEEIALKEELELQGIKAAAVDFGGVFINILPKIIEHTIVAAQRQGVVANNHVGEGAVVGAIQSALEQIKIKAMGQNVGGKIGIARYNQHLCVALYSGVGVLHFNEVVTAISHRALKDA